MLWRQLLNLSVPCQAIGAASLSRDTWSSAHAPSGMVHSADHGLMDIDDHEPSSPAAAVSSRLGALPEAAALTTTRCPGQRTAHQVSLFP